MPGSKVLGASPGASSAEPTDQGANDAGGPAVAVGRRWSLRLSDNPLVHVVARMPVRAGTKLLVAFVGSVVLLVVVGILGLRVLGQSNNRVETLGGLQQRAATYRGLRTEGRQIRLLLGLRAGGGDLSLYTGGQSSAPPD